MPKLKKSEKDLQQELHKMLETHPPFEFMPKSVFSKLMNSASIKTVRKGSKILTQGKRCDNLYVLLEGKVGVYLGDQFLYFLNQKGDIFGEVSFITDGLSTATVKVESKATLAIINHEVLSKIGAKHFYSWVGRILSDKLARTSMAIHQMEDFFKEMDEGELEDLKKFSEGLDEMPLFSEVGKIVRTFYEKMKVIRADIPTRLGEMSQHDMDDASRRLQHIVEMTEAAANKTMDLAEAMLDQLAERSNEQSAALEQIEAALKTPKLPKAVKDALEAAQQTIQNDQEVSMNHQGLLTDVLVAQDYQDLTGQIINKIISLLSMLETTLVDLIDTFGQVYVKNIPAPPEDELQGPLNKDSADRQSQEDTDALLASLGF